jgi:hypothetical protein
MAAGRPLARTWRFALRGGARRCFPRAFRCCTMCSRWDGPCATGSSSRRRRAVRATLFPFPPPARLELTAQLRRRRRDARRCILLRTQSAQSIFQYWSTLAGSQGTACAFHIRAIQGTTIELGDADGAAAVTDQPFGATSKWAASSWLALMAAEARRRARSNVRSSSGTPGLSDNSPETVVKGDQPLPPRRSSSRATDDFRYAAAHPPVQPRGDQCG